MEKRSVINTTLPADVHKQLRILAAEKGRRQNDLLVEAIRDLLRKYGKETESE